MKESTIYILSGSNLQSGKGFVKKHSWIHIHSHILFFWTPTYAQGKKLHNCNFNERDELNQRTKVWHLELILLGRYFTSCNLTGQWQKEVILKFFLNRIQFFPFLIKRHNEDASTSLLWMINLFQKVALVSKIQAVVFYIESIKSLGDLYFNFHIYHKHFFFFNEQTKTCLG